MIVLNNIKMIYSYMHFKVIKLDKLAMAFIVVQCICKGTSTPMNTVNSYVGYNTTLQCPIPLSDTIRDMRWYQENGYTKTVYDITGTEHTSTHIRYTADRATGSLTIQNVTEKDASIYKCTVVDGDYIKDSYITLKVSNRPDEFAKTVSVGSTITLKCFTSLQENTPNIRWNLKIKDNIYDITSSGHLSLLDRFSADPKSGALTIKNVQQQDVGIYVCSTLNGETMRKVSLQMDAENETMPLVIVKMQYQPLGSSNRCPLLEQSVLKLGYMIIITACAKIYMPKLNLYWYKNNELLQHHHSHHRNHNVKSQCYDGIETKLQYVVTRQDDGASIFIRAAGPNNIVVDGTSIGFALHVIPDEAVSNQSNYFSTTPTSTLTLVAVILLPSMLLIACILFVKWRRLKLVQVTAYTIHGSSYVRV